MALAWQLMIFALLLLLGHVQLASGVVVNVGDSVNFTATENCGAQTEFKLKTQDNTRTVATRIRGVWEAADGYAGRIEHLSPSSLRLTGVNFNDKGLFEFSCGNTVVTRIDVTIVVPFDVSAEEGGTALLPCHFSTTGGRVQRVRWERNGELVLQLERASTQTRYGGEFEGRAFVSRDWHSTGNLSLTLTEVRFEDQADFICYIDEGQKRGNPAAVRMRVNRRASVQITNTPSCEPPSETPTGEKMGTGTIISVTLNVIFLGCLALVCLGVYLKYFKSNASSGATGGGGPSGDEESTPFTAPSGSQVNGGPPAPN